MIRKLIPAALLIVWIITAGGSDVEAIDLTKQGFLDKHIAGGRIGVWSNTGEEETADEAVDFSKSSVYAEFFYAHRIWKPLSIEILLGIYSRGDVEYYRDVDPVTGNAVSTFTSSVNLYPIFISPKFYPLYYVASMPLHIYLQPGVGLVYGSQRVVSYDENYSYYYGFQYEESRAKFTYLLSGGMEIPLSRQIAISSNIKYVPVKYGKKLAQIRDYSGWSFTLGAAYVFGNK